VTHGQKQVWRGSFWRSVGNPRRTHPRRWNLGQILQPTAAMIVFGGTLGAVMLQFPLPIILLAVRQLGSVFVNSHRDPEADHSATRAIRAKARREGIVSLDAELAEIEDPFLRKSLMLAVDGTEPQELRKMMELELEQSGRARRTPFRRFSESAGGFAPHGVASSEPSWG